VYRGFKSLLRYQAQPPAQFPSAQRLPHLVEQRLGVVTRRHRLLHVDADEMRWRVRLQLQGIGWVDLSSLAASEADVTLSGSRHALLSASEKASISGNGSVVLVSKPRALELNLGDSGRVFTLGQ